MDRRLGCFEVSARVLDDCAGLTHLFFGMVVLRAQEQWATSKIEYLAWHPSFRRVPQGEVVPRYEPEFDATTGAVTWRERTPCAS